MAESAASGRAACWAGALPVRFALASDEVTTLHPPPPIHAVVPRHALLPLVIGRVREHFAAFAPPLGGQMWLEYGETPLRWQLPVGVVFDLLAGAEAEASLPWELTVRFQRFPAEEVASGAAADAEATLLNALKEATCVQCGSALPVMTLPPELTQKLVAAVVAGRHDDFEPVRAEVRRRALGQLRGGSSSGGDEALAMKAVPARVHTSQRDWRQLAMPPTLDDGSPRRLRHLLASLLPQHFGEAEGEPAAPPPTVLVQGVAVPLDSPLAWLADACAHADGFLYVVVRGLPP